MVILDLFSRVDVHFSRNGRTTKLISGWLFFLRLELLILCFLKLLVCKKANQVDLFVNAIDFKSLVCVFITETTIVTVGIRA